MFFMDLQYLRIIPKLQLVLLLVCPLLFFTDLTRNPYYTQITILHITVCAIWLIWIVHSFQKQMWVNISTPLDIPLLLALSVMGLSVVVSCFMHPQMRAPILSESSKRLMLSIVNGYLVYAMVLRSATSQMLKRWVLCVYAVSTLASAYGISQYFGIELFWSQTLNPYGSRPVSTFGNPNFLSSFLVLTIPLATADYVRRFTAVPRAILLLVILTSLAGITATLTRSSWFGLLVGLLVLFWGLYQSKEKKTSLGKVSGTLLVLGCCAILALWPKNSGGVYSATVAERLSEALEAKKNHYPPVYQRLLIWTSAWSMVQDHPFLGKGWGCFELFYPFYQGSQLYLEPFKYLRTHANNSHNEILEQWSQVGTIGLGIQLWFWAVFIRLAFSMRKRLKGEHASLFWGFFAGVVGFWIDNLLNVTLHFAVPMMFFWWWLGASASIDPDMRQTRTISTVPLLRRIPLVFSGVLLVVFMIRGMTIWAQEIYFFSGFKLSKGGQNLGLAIQELEKAYRFNRWDVNTDYELANVYARLGQKDKALEMYYRAYLSNSGYDEIYFNRATIRTQLDQIPQAIADYRFCLNINPMSKEAYNALTGLYYRDFAKYGAQADSVYKQALLFFPKDRDLWNNYGYLLTQQERWKDAVHAYEQSLLIDPNYELAKHNLSIVASKAQLIK